MGAGASARPSDDIRDQALFEKVVKYEQKIAKLERESEDDEAEAKREKLAVYLRQQYESDASRWSRAPAWAEEKVSDTARSWLATTGPVTRTGVWVRVGSALLHGRATASATGEWPTRYWPAAPLVCQRNFQT